MQRIRFVFCGLLLALGLLFCPVPAMASDGFIGGLEDLTNTREVQGQDVAYEERYQEEYEPEFREVDTTPVRALPEDATTVDYINSTVDSFNTSGVSGDSSDNTMLGFLRTFFHARNNALANRLLELMLLPAIGMVFVWWGVRKSKNMIMNGFKKGRIKL